MSGLSVPVPALSFEFTAERFDSRARAVDLLDALGMTEFNYSFGESLELHFDDWVSRDDLLDFLRLPINAPPDSFGDVYARRAGSSAGDARSRVGVGAALRRLFSRSSDATRRVPGER